MNSVRLHPLGLHHAKKTLEWTNDPELMRLLNRAQPVSTEEHDRWFDGIQKREDCCYFAIETTDGIHLGNVWLWNVDPLYGHAELRIVMGLDNVGKGTGTEAIKLVCEYAFEQLKMYKVYAYVLAINPRARRSFEKAGFLLEDTLREDRWTGENFTDVYLLARHFTRNVGKAQSYDSRGKRRS